METTRSGLGGGVVAALLIGFLLHRFAGLPIELAAASGLLAVAAQELELTSGGEMTEGREVWLSWTNESLVCLSAD